MNRVSVKKNRYGILLLLASISLAIQATNGKERLQELLRKRPDLAEKFMKEVAKRDGKAVKPRPAPKPIVLPEPEPTPAPEPKPARPPEFAEPEGPDKQRREPAPAPAPTREPTPAPEPKPEHKPEPPKPVVKPWMTDSELSDINTIFTVLESNAMRVLVCLDAFFCKKNCQAYPTHIACLKNQLAYLQNNLLAKFPQAETRERSNIFKTFHAIAKTLEQGELTVLKIINPKPSGVPEFTKRYYAISSILETLQKQANQAMAQLKKEMRPDMAPRLQKLHTAINRMFNFSQNLPNPLQLIGIVRHRLSK